MGAELIEHREAAGMSLRAVSRKLGWSAPHVSQMETGGRPPSPADVSAYLAACGPHRRAEYDRLVALAAESDTRYLVRPHGPELPDELRSLIVQESIAAEIIEFEPLVVPGLLQSEGYVRALLRWGGMLKPESLEMRVQARLARQGLLHRAWPPKYERFPPLVYTEGLTVGTFMDGPADVANHREFLSKLDAVALNEGESRAWVADLGSRPRSSGGHTLMPIPERTGLTWRKSRYSNASGNNCVEVARLASSVAVRDSKAPTSGHLSLTPSAWRAFLAGT
ncbi:Scr1 family TA system antitoxin-like transcriptional regulator [Amycolatopsis sp. NPDC051128]|uniref:Scr1 family TA system antitoxin-like transcriptional regulator n=1 Tax=Amycolatopsis sp. NPDC051128 TaxID=3155412 RepID=UPI00342D4C3C